MTEREIFTAALHQQDPAERAAFLDRACGEDQAQRQRVESLLREHEHLGSFLEQPAEGLGGPPAAREDLGTLIGPYKLVQVIGEGGMGTVYMAQQTEPVKRLVALKVSKPDMDSREVLARFEAERQALALMDHPHIAKVLDAGTTESGRPYFVMELVKGVSITKYCDERHLTPRERLGLFVPVCQAVQHAHQKGIIHRDLKPSNVLVARYDSKPVPKVIDFGVAKATGQQLTEKTLVTGFGAIVGTLEYMSPEQAELNQLDIDTRSDIYALGVLLDELLTGTTPLQRERLKGTSLLEVLRLIREEEPPRPSTRLSTTEQLAPIAANRGLEPKKLSGLVRGALDWIVMKALEKDRNRRYETANGLARDLERYLRDEPVQACPPSTAYRVRKFAQRHKRALATLALLGLMLLATVVVLAVSNLRIKEEQQQTRAALDRERQTLYYHRIALADSYWSAGQMTLAEQLLDECPSSFRQWEWHYLKRLCHTDLLTLRARRFVTSVAFSPDGQLLATGLWGMERFRDTRPHPEGRNSVTDQDGAVVLWDARTGQELRTLPRHLQGVHSLAFGPDGRFLASAGRDAAIRVWDVQTGQEVRTLRGHAGAVHSVAFGPDGRRLATGGEDKTVRRWDASTGQEILRLLGHRDQVTAVAFSPRGPLLASASYDGTVRVWEALARISHRWDGKGAWFKSRHGSNLGNTHGRPVSSQGFYTIVLASQTLGRKCYPGSTA